MTSLNRRQFLGTTALAASASAAGAGGISAPDPVEMKTLEGTGRVWTIWRDPGRFTKNPDIIRFPSGNMMLVFCDDDQHWAQALTRITTLETTDNGKTWGNPQVIAEADVRKGQERWVTPRISRLRSGRVMVVCDHDDYHHAHEDQPSGIWMWTSDDQGRTWSAPRLTGVPGLEPGRIVELADGTLLLSAHMEFRDNFKNAEFVMRSSDGGMTWKDLSVIAKDRVHNFCEGQIAILSMGVLACVMRDNNHNGYPSWVSFSYDQGRNWTDPLPMPFSGDRPFPGQLPDGRVLITYRNQSGNAGTHAWLGDLFTGTGFQVFGTHYGDHCTIEDATLHITHQGEGETRYVVMPPESFRSNLVFEAALRVEGPADAACAVMNLGRTGITAYISSDKIWCSFGRRVGLGPNPPHNFQFGVDALHAVDMTKEHKITLRTSHGLFRLEVDGTTALQYVIVQEFPLEPTMFECPKQSTGAVWLRSLAYQVVNETEPDYAWAWEARSGKLPDQYQYDRIMVIAANPPQLGKTPDEGYSSWLQLPDGKIYFVDYSNRGDTPPASHLYAALFSVDDLPNAACK